MKLDSYYIDFDKSIGEDFSEYEFDEQGIPLVRFYRSAEWQHNPVTVCQYALANYNEYIKSGNHQFKTIFLKQLNWLLENYESGPNDSIVWTYKFNSSFYNLKMPWISGMAQGEALSVLLRAFQLTENSDYLSLADKIWNIFSVPVTSGGIRSTYPNGDVLIEEYPTQPCSCVLNGFIFALFGVYDYYKVTQKEQVFLLFNQCLKSLKNNLHKYDSSYWSYYDLWRPYRLTSRFYHRLHITLLNVLFQLTNENHFFRTSQRWLKYKKNPICNIRWAIGKMKERIAY